MHRFAVRPVSGTSATIFHSRDFQAPDGRRCKASMDSLAAMGKAGGPQGRQRMELAEQQAAMLAETAQLLMMGDRPQDQMYG